MNQNKPFIHLLKTPYHEYVYDVNTNEIISISKALYDYLWMQQNKPELSISPTSDVEKEIQILKASGYLKDKHPEKIENTQIDFVENSLEHGIMKLTLQVTQRCNFRCSYCDYSNDDALRNRKHSPKSMSWETAKKAIDFFSHRIRDSKSVSVGFYGGEPLLEFGLIKRCIEYINEVLEGKAFSYTITTNASILTPEIARFLYENNVSLVISLDGPKEIHDSNRRFAADGSGTYDVVMHNLDRIREELPDYYEKLSFNSVIDPLNDYACTRDFFCAQHAGRSISTPLLVPQTGTRQVYSEEFSRAFRNENLLGYLYLLGIFCENEISPLALNAAQEMRMFIDTHLLKRVELPSRLGHGGPCMPGVLRLFVDIDGRLFPCERVSESSGNMDIGHIDTGFNLDKVISLLNISQLTEKSCKNCWGITHCTICARDADDTKELSADMISRKCKSTLVNIESKLLGYIALKETKDMIRHIIK